jgi:hypothetical protein
VTCSRNRGRCNQSSTSQPRHHPFVIDHCAVDSPLLESCTEHNYLHFSLLYQILLKEVLGSEAGTMVTAAAAARDGVATQPQQAANGHSGLWYFAFGSMCNPTSLNRRGIFPTASHPAQLPGYKLAFELGGCLLCCPCPCLVLHSRRVAFMSVAFGLAAALSRWICAKICIMQL